MAVESGVVPWFADLANYLVSGKLPPDLNFQQKKRFLHEAKSYFWDDPLLFKQCADGMIRRCVPKDEIESILHHCHSTDYGGHFGSNRTAMKVLQSGLFWPTLFEDARHFVE